MACALSEADARFPSGVRGCAMQAGWTGPDRTRVRVAYQVHAISDHGRSYLEGLTESEFAKSIDEWSDMIQAMA